MILVYLFVITPLSCSVVCNDPASQFNCIKKCQFLDSPSEISAWPTPGFVSLYPVLSFLYPPSVQSGPKTGSITIIRAHTPSIYLKCVFNYFGQMDMAEKTPQSFETFEFVTPWPETSSSLTLGYCCWKTQVCSKAIGSEGPLNRHKLFDRG